MSIFDLNKAKKSSESNPLLPGLRGIKLTEVISKEFESKSGDTQNIIEFKFNGVSPDSGYYSETFFESNFDRDSAFNSSKTDEEFEKMTERTISKLRTIIDKFILIEVLPSGKNFKDLCNKIAQLFVDDTSWKEIEGQIKLVYSGKDKIITPGFKFLSTPLDKEVLSITKSKYDRITPLPAPDTEAAFKSLSDDFDEKDDEPLF
jgi:hypothetical protein